MTGINVQKGSNNQISQKSNSFLFDGEKVITTMDEVVFYNRAARMGKSMHNAHERGKAHYENKYNPSQSSGSEYNPKILAYVGNEVKREGTLIITDKRLIMSKSGTDFSSQNLIMSMSYDPETIKKEIEYISINNREALRQLKENSDLKSFLKGKNLPFATKFGFIPSVSAINEIEIGKVFKSMNVKYSVVDLYTIERKHHLRLEPDEYYLPNTKPLPPLPPNATKEQIKDRKREEKKQKKDVKSLEKYKKLLRKNQGDTIARKGASIMIDKNKIIVPKQVLNFILPEKNQKSAIVEEVAKRINSGKEYLNNNKQVEQDYISLRMMRK